MNNDAFFRRSCVHRILYEFDVGQQAIPRCRFGFDSAWPPGSHLSQQWRWPQGDGPWCRHPHAKRQTGSAAYDGVIFSDDHGRSWKAGGKTTGPVSESQIVELMDGSLMFNARGSPNRTVTISRDGGETWGAPWRDPVLTDSELWEECQASLIRYRREGKAPARNRLLFANPADRKYRFDVTVRLSYDEGKTWPVAKLIHKGSGAYTSMIVFPDGSTGLIYETGNSYDGVVEYYGKLAFARFNLEWLTGGKDK